MLLLWASYVADEYSRTGSVNPGSLSPPQSEFHLEHYLQYHLDRESACHGVYLPVTKLNTITRLVSSTAAKCLRVCCFFLPE